jgi:hypothetical protein
VIASEQKQKILDADLANIIRKVKAGKPLSARERELIEAKPEPQPQSKSTSPIPTAALPEKAATIARAAALLQASGLNVTKDFLRKLKREGVPGFEEKSGRINLTLLAPEVRRRLAEPSAAPMLEDKSSLENRKLLAQAEKIEFELREMRGQFVERTAVINSNRRLANALRKLLRKLETEMPAAVAGKDLPEARAYGVRLHDQLLGAIQAWSDEWPE